MIHPFQVGDIFLVQRLGRQATRLNTIHSLLRPYSAVWTSLATVAPWNDGKLSTSVLRQHGHGLARAGYLQARKRARRPEVDILVLAPGLDKPWGHPAIWEKLLSDYSHQAAQHNISRIYVDSPDQPLPVTSFEHVGFKVFSHQTIWRLAPQRAEHFEYLISAHIRPFAKQDEWGARQLYARVTPSDVQQAEGAQDGAPISPPLLDCWMPGMCANFVLEEGQQIQGCLQIATGARGYWLQLWVDTLDPNTDFIHQLLRYGLNYLQQAPRRHIYIGVSSYQGGLDSILTEYGFAPFTDRAKMVKHVLQWVREPVALQSLVLEPVGGAIPTQFSTPKGVVHIEVPGTQPDTPSSLSRRSLGDVQRLTRSRHRHTARFPRVVSTIG